MAAESCKNNSVSYEFLSTRVTCDYIYCVLFKSMGLGRRLNLESGWLVHTYLYYFPLSSSHCLYVRNFALRTTKLCDG